LVVEDSPDDLDLTLRSFRNVGADVAVLAVEDGARALDLLGLRGPTAPKVRPDLLLLDLKVPLADGEEICRAVRAHPLLASVPVVVFSSSNLPDDVARCRAAGATEYLRKPLDPTEYVQEIRQAVRRFLASGES
jgi:CheY-like chemotaxis protein